MVPAGSGLGGSLTDFSNVNSALSPLLPAPGHLGPGFLPSPTAMHSRPLMA